MEFNGSHRGGMSRAPKDIDELFRANPA